MTSPLVSIITPTTHDREHFNERIRRVVADQDYPNIEHVMCYDNSRVLGQKMNDMIARAKGDIIVNMDSDDIFAPDWTKNIVQHLLDTGADVVGLKKAYFYNEEKGQMWSYTYPDRDTFLHGGTMAHTRDYWLRNPYLSQRVGYDVAFVSNSYVKSRPFDYSDGFIATVHTGNTSPKNTTGSRWELHQNIPMSLHTLLADFPLKT